MRKKSRLFKVFLSIFASLLGLLERDLMVFLGCQINHR